MTTPASRSLERVNVPTMRWPGTWLWAGILTMGGAVVLGVALGQLYGANAFYFAAASGAIPFLISIPLDSKFRLRSIQKRAHEAGISFEQVPRFPRMTDISKVTDDKLAMEIQHRDTDAYLEFTKASPFHAFSPVLGNDGRVFVGRVPELARETWVCIGLGVGSQKVPATFGVAVRAESPTGSGLHVNPSKLSRGRRHSGDEVILPDPEFVKHWSAKCDDSESAIRLLTAEMRAVIMLEVSATSQFWSMDIAPQRGSWIWFNDWMMYMRAGYAGARHLQPLAEWINQVADIYEAGLRDSEPAEHQ